MTPITTRLMPTAARPLLGLTVMVVEDSRFASEALRQMCLHSGARIRRADCLKSARRHLCAYFPSVSIVDMGLPDGDGAELIAQLRERSGELAPVIGTSGDPATEPDALAAGAHAFLPKPIQGLATFEQTILNLLPDTARPRGPRLLRDDLPPVDPAALRDDLDHVERMSRGDVDGDTRRYLGRFVAGIARCSEDPDLLEVAETLSVMGDATSLAQLRQQVVARLSSDAGVFA